MAATACMPTACPVNVTTGTSLSTVVLAIFLDGIARIDNAQTRVAGTFHLGYSCHFQASSGDIVLKDEQSLIGFILTPEYLFRCYLFNNIWLLVVRSLFGPRDVGSSVMVKKVSVSATGQGAEATLEASTREGDVAGPESILSIEKAQRMAEFFGGLSDPNRWRILSALALTELRVRDLATTVGMTESAVSHQLRILRTLRLVSYRKRGRNVFYCLKDHHIFNLYRDVSEHLDEPEEDPEAL